MLECRVDQSHETSFSRSLYGAIGSSYGALVAYLASGFSPGAGGRCCSLGHRSSNRKSRIAATLRYARFFCGAALACTIGWAAKEVEGDYRIVLSKPAPRPDTTYEDVSFKIQLDFQLKTVAIQIHNKTSKVARLVWNDAAFSDTDGKSSPLIHDTTIRMDLDRTKSDAIILPDSSLSAVAFPRANVLDVAGSTTIFNILPFCPQCMGMAGKSMKVYLPMKVGDNRIDYYLQAFILSVKPKQ